MKAFPAKQLRSEQTHEKLLQAGLKLLRSKSFDDISIAQIANCAGCSVGSFYLRFRNKEAFFEFLIESINGTLQEGVRSKLTEEKVKDLTLAQRCDFALTTTWKPIDSSRVSFVPPCNTASMAATTGSLCAITA
jgi:AcrR family transcriptional regulator